MNRTRRRPLFRWRDWMLITAAMALAVGMGWAIYRVGLLRDQTDALALALTQQRAQAEQSGLTPVAPRPEDIQRNPTIIKGPAGQSGATGPTGRTGPEGQPGPSGPAGKSGSIGPSGKPGIDGQPGSDGKDGATGPPGATGPAGKDGSDGKNGSDGKDGEPPASFTWRDVLGVQYTCRRDSGSSDSSPTYTCSRGD